MRAVLFLAFLLIFFPGAECAAAPGRTVHGNPFYQPAEPRLRYPIYDTAILAEGQPLEFRWYNNYADTRGFILKVYGGYNMYADALILRKELPAGAASFKADGALFREGGVYTWSLVRVSSAGYKSGRSFNSFRVARGPGKKQGF
ncbi:MAG: hypothetical protein WC432_02725 [Candidatus Omnitrophota bacterium]|jgi:hypothetical protein